MKKIILCLVLTLGFGFFSIAQGDLQFNQVINETYSGVGSGNSNSRINIGSITVPSGKVWKVQTASITMATGTNGSYVFNGSSYYNHTVYIGDNMVFMYMDSPDEALGQLLPLWLGPGSYDVGCAQGLSVNAKIAISAIEFNVVP
ncbi:hypothetical protein OAN33_03825 [Flavobacteriales bacterium]|nr:hypothetical protein [Flavobacteriales bacterium]